MPQPLSAQSRRRQCNVHASARWMLSRNFAGRYGAARDARSTDVCPRVHAADIATHTHRLTGYCPRFTEPSRKLMPADDCIVELPQKGASLRLIRGSFASVDVAAGTVMIAFYRGGERPDAGATIMKTNSASPAIARATPPLQRRVAPTTNGASTLAQPPVAVPAAGRPRTRGPPVAYPRNL